MSAPRPVVSARAEANYAWLTDVGLTDADQDGGWVMLHLCEAHARMSGPLGDLVDHDARGSGRRRMLDPNRAPAAALPALAENYAGVDPGRLPEGDLRALIRERPRQGRCTTPQMRSAVLRTLTGPAPYLRIDPNFPATSIVTVSTRESQTPSVTALLLAAETQAPYWVQVRHRFVERPTWGDVQPGVSWDVRRNGQPVPWDDVTLDDVAPEETP